MNIHEYQAKALLTEYGVAVLRGQVAYTPEEAEQAARALGGPIWVVKAQIHAGGRGKGGGVKLAKSVEEVRQLANDMLGMTLVTHQTGPAGPASSSASMSRTAATSPASSISAPCSTAPPRASPSWPRPRAASRSRRWRPSTPRRS